MRAAPWTNRRGALRTDDVEDGHVDAPGRVGPEAPHSPRHRARPGRTAPRAPSRRERLPAPTGRGVSRYSSPHTARRNRSIANSGPCDRDASNSGARPAAASSGLSRATRRRLEQGDRTRPHIVATRQREGDKTAVRVADQVRVVETDVAQQPRTELGVVVDAEPGTVARRGPPIAQHRVRGHALDEW